MEEEYLNQAQVSEYVEDDTNNISPIEINDVDRSQNMLNCLPFKNDENNTDNFIHLDLKSINKLEIKRQEVIKTNNISLNKPLGLSLEDGVYTYIIFKCLVGDEFIFLYEKVDDVNEIRTKHKNYLAYCNTENKLVYVAGEFLKNDKFTFNFASGTFMLDKTSGEGDREKYKRLIHAAFPNLSIHINFTINDTDSFIDEEFKKITTDNPLYETHYKQYSTLFKTKQECDTFGVCHMYCDPIWNRNAPKKIHRRCGEHCPQRELLLKLKNGGKTKANKKKTKANKNKNKNKSKTNKNKTNKNKTNKNKTNKSKTNKNKTNKSKTNKNKTNKNKIKKTQKRLNRM
jgi:hypothetical protein